MLLALAILSALAVFGMSRIGALDHPVARSSHTRPTPKGGGVGIALAFAAGMLLGPHPMAGDAVLTVAALFLAACSYADDVLDWPFWRKLAAQAAAAFAVLLAGFSPWEVSLPGLGLLPLPVVAPTIGLAWLLFVTNAVNFHGRAERAGRGQCGDWLHNSGWHGRRIPSLAGMPGGGWGSGIPAVQLSGCPHLHGRRG